MAWWRERRQKMLAAVALFDLQGLKGAHAARYSSLPDEGSLDHPGGPPAPRRVVSGWRAGSCP